MKLLLTLLIFSSVFCRAQSTKEDLSSAGFWYYDFMRYKGTLKKGQVTQANIDRLQVAINYADTSIKKVLSYEDPGMGEKMDMTVAEFFRIDLQYEMGRVFFFDMDRPKEAYELLKKLENSMHFFDNGTHYTLYYQVYGKDYKIEYDNVKDYAVDYYTLMAVICKALSNPDEGAEYNKKALYHRYATAWSKYLNTKSLIVYKFDKHEEDKELMDYHLILLKSFLNLDRKDSLKIAKDTVTDDLLCYNSIIYLLNQHPELSNSGQTYWEVGEIFYHSKDYKQAAECFKRAMQESNEYAYNHGRNVANVAMQLNDKEFGMSIIDGIVKKTDNLEAKCYLLEVIAETYEYFGMASEAKSYGKKISKCKKVDKREKIKDRNFYRSLNRY